MHINYSSKHRALACNHLMLIIILQRATYQMCTINTVVYVTLYAEIGHLSKNIILKLAMDYENITPDEPL